MPFVGRGHPICALGMNDWQGDVGVLCRASPGEQLFTDKALAQVLIDHNEHHASSRVRW